MATVAGDRFSASPREWEWRTAILARISGVLHDDVGPSLTAAGFHLHLAQQDPEEYRAAAVAIDSSLSVLRRLSYLSHPEVAARFGIVRSFELLTDCVAPSFRGTVRLRIEGEPQLAASEAQAWFEDAAAAMVTATARAPQGRFVAVLTPHAWRIEPEEEAP